MVGRPGLDFVALVRRDGARRRNRRHLLCIGWVTLSVLTPFYHPYARLWLPVEAFGWLLMGGVFVGIRSSVEVAGRGARWTWSRTSDPLPWFALFCVAVGGDILRIPVEASNACPCWDRATR